MSKKANKATGAPSNEAPATLEEAMDLITDLKQKHESLERYNVDLSNQLSDAAQQILHQESLISELRNEPTENGKPVFNLDGITYQANCGKFTLDGRTYAASELLENTDLQRRLVNMRVGFIKKV